MPRHQFSRFSSFDSSAPDAAHSCLPLPLVQLQRQHRRVDDLIGVDAGVLVQIRAGAGLAALSDARGHERAPQTPASPYHEQHAGADLSGENRFSPFHPP